MQQENEVLLSICLDLLTDLETVPCGHNFCLDCIRTQWDEDQKESHSCPQCRQSFSPRPALVKNRVGRAGGEAEGLEVLPGGSHLVL